MSAKTVPALLVSLAIASDAVDAAQLPAPQFASPLTAIAAGRDEAFGATLAPAQSDDAKQSREDRIQAVIQRIAQEAETVRAAFATALPADRIRATKAAVAHFSPETASDGAARSFEGNGPSLSFMRQLLFVPISVAGVSADSIIQTIGQFERTPKLEDSYYEYSEPRDLVASSIISLPGSRESLTTQIRPPMVEDRVYALKKCRHVVVLGWFCNTGLYQVRNLGGESKRLKSLITFLRPLPKGADNHVFDDARATNAADGYTALYVVAEAGNLVLVYSLGVQSKAEAPRQQTLLIQGHKAEYRQLVSHIEAKLGTGTLPF